MKKISRILVAIDGSARSYAALAYLGKLLSKQVEIVLFHIMAEAPEPLRELSPDPSYEKESYSLALWKTRQEEFIAEFMTLACDILYASGFSKDAVTVKTQALGSGVARDILTESSAP